MNLKIMHIVNAVVFVLTTLYCGISMADFDKESQNRFSKKIKAILPANWKVVEEKQGVIPYNHYWGLKYDGPKGLLFALEGDKPVFMHWKDKKNGEWHKEPLAKEALELYIMPESYSESWKRFFVMKSPEGAELLFNGNNLKIYVNPCQRIVSPDKFKDKFNEILPKAQTTGWPDSPANKGSLSWGTWEEDIKKAFQGE